MSPKTIAPNVVSWASDLDPNAAEQAARSATLPFIDGHIALMDIDQVMADQTDLVTIEHGLYQILNYKGT